jgi:dTDP-glucose 4,6-dehydratase
VYEWSDLRIQARAVCHDRSDAGHAVLLCVSHPAWITGIRDWLYVEDHADALLLVVQKGELGRSYNIGGENERSNLELVKTLCAILDRLQPKAGDESYADQITFVADRPGHDARYAIDPSRIRNELGWRPSVTVEEGLEKTVQWYLENEDWWRPLLLRQGLGQRLGWISSE